MAIPSTSQNIFNPQIYSFLSNPPVQREFHHIDGKSNKLGVLREIFERILTPLYGSQEDALNKIILGKDRTCYLLYEEETPVGVIVFKTILSDEYMSYNVKRSIEIKSLFIVSSENNSGRGLGTVLLDKVIEEANKLKLNHDSLHVTVSETKTESLMFFKKKGFRVMHEWQDRYKDGVKEYLLSRPAALSFNVGDRNPTENSVISITQQLQGASLSAAISTIAKALFTLQNVHWDDIHTLKLLSDGTFISGSKDNSLYKWNQRGELVKVVKEVDPVAMDSGDWITAAEVINDEYWVSGERNGRASLWTTAGDFVKNLQFRLPRRDHISLPQNQRRINALATGLNKQKPSVFVGFPTMFDEYNFMEGRTSTSTQVHKNDWVYCIQPLTENRLLAAVGGVLESWKRGSWGWQKEKMLLPEDRKEGKYRSFISSVTPLKSSPHHFGLGVFNGSIKVFDIEKEQIARQWRGHQQRIWSIENLSKGLFATSGEDRTIKLWDLRQPKYVTSLEGHVGPVSALLQINENQLIAGTCAEDLRGKNEGAQIVFYDVRLT